MLLKQPVLIAEDEDFIVELVKTALKGTDTVCIRARNGLEAIHLLRLYAPLLLVLDVMMPQMDGMQAAKQIREDPLLTKTPILMLTALSAVDNKVQGLDAGADAYIPKPFDMREFVAQVRALLRGNREESMRMRNPITDLPAVASVQQYLSTALENRESIGIAHFSIRDFYPLAEQIGFEPAGNIIRKMADLLQDRLRTHMQYTAFLGHVGGGDFIIGMPSEGIEPLVRDVVRSFDEEHTAWTEHALPAPYHILGGVAFTDGLIAGQENQLAERVAAAMETAAERSGSRHVVWRTRA